MSEALTYFATAMAVVILLVYLWAAVSVIRSDKTTGINIAWTFALFIFLVLGLIAWGIAGPRGSKEGPTSPERSKR
ncbi:PLD nuclease N-terminal domain-containing protein [Pseudomonas yamanorum]|uniref:PLD nuclease N-terminal domain-containing protein n=1 Tax=Pseudomonas yamanorum TaxID=515393 RepID=UPI003D35B02F